MLHTYVIALHGEQHCAGCLPFADTLATGHYMAHGYMYCTMLKKLVRLGCITPNPKCTVLMRVHT